MTIFKRLAAVFMLSSSLLGAFFLLAGVNPAGANSIPVAAETAGGITSTTIMTRTSWDIHFTFTPTPSLRDLDCPTADFCKAVGTEGTVYSWDGSNWSSETITPATHLYQVSCPMTSWCKAGGNGAIWSWDGSVWSADEIPAGAEQFVFGMECVDEQFCIAYGSAPITTHPFVTSTVLTWDGTAWSVDADTPGSFIMDCLSETYCKGTKMIRTSQVYFYIYGWDGMTTTVETQPNPFFIYDIECLSEQFCKALSDDQYSSVLSWDGTEWSGESLTPTLLSTDTLKAISCSSETACKAISWQGYVVSWDGTEWRLEEQFAATLGSTQLECPTAAVCYGVALNSMGETSGFVFGMYSQILQDVSDGFVLEISEEPTCLTGVTVTQHEENHPAAPAGMQTGRYWSVDVPCTDPLMAELTLSSPLTPTAEMQICYQNIEGGLWQCRQDGFTAETITVNHLTSLSDWFIGVPDPSLTHTVYLPVLVTE